MPPSGSIYDTLLTNNQLSDPLHKHNQNEDDSVEGGHDCGPTDHDATNEGMFFQMLIANE